ncbi:efflux transporter outer membrane subunit [Aliiroseovarius sp. Z3]|uniref:efflux transporter outer membrane subunit n=1 Tax=Aliiroseovarius sp. Z3 TaxID=2811402 RepID=UPI0023B25C94|nr:efflux transporter outer membrane subunit [Aliiroseovarius sp. Z3]MDE9451649.1 efflux transporter outer membrane subunit [Aliiroseovarius sp. Z3]
MKQINGRKAPVLGCVLAATIGLSGCATDEPYKLPFFKFAKSYSSVSSHAVPVPLANDTWWMGFKDPVFNKLVERALAGNYDLEIAREKVIEARANRDAVPGLLSVSPTATHRYAQPPGGTASHSSNARLNLDWMLDPYGLRRQQIQAAGARIDIADAEEDAARLTVLLNLSNAYVDLRYNQRLLNLRRQQLASRRNAVTQTKQLFDRRAATKLDVVQTEALVAETQTQIPALIAAIRAGKTEIAVLTGVAPGRLGVNLDGNASQPRPSKTLKTGVPADILRNRPDMKIAERSYYEAITNVGIARANMYPSLSLSGMIGFGKNSAGDGLEYSIGPTLNLPSLPMNSEKSRVAARQSAARQAYAGWQSAVLSSVSEVESALAAYHGSRSAVVESQRRVRLNREARDLTQELLKQEGATIRDLISAEERIADADTALADNLRQLARNYVRLNIALGAGSQFGEPEEETVVEVKSASSVSN